MSELNTSRHWWSWRSCFATGKYNKTKFKKQQSNHQSKPQNGHTHKKRLPPVDEKATILSDSDRSSENPISNDSHHHHHHLNSNGYSMKNELSSNENENNFIDSDSIQRTVIGSINSKIINSKPSSTVRATQLDAIVEDSSEEYIDELDETIQPVRLQTDRELINDSFVLYSRLFDLIKLNHIIIQFNDNGYFLGDFTYQLSKLKLKIDDIKRVSTEIPRDAELLEAKYSTLLATIECLSLLLKVAQISSSRSFINRLMSSIEQRMDQLTKLVQLSSSISINQKQYDLIDDDLLSFRSALSSYEHLSTILS